MGLISHSTMGGATKGERGSILPLLIGLMAMLSLVSGGVVNLSSLYLSHRALYQIADEAALKAVTHLDPDRYYTTGAAVFVPTEDHAQIIRDVIAHSSLTSVEVEEIDIDNAGVAVTLAHRVTLPWPLLVDSVVIRAHARAEALTTS